MFGMKVLSAQGAPPARRGGGPRDPKLDGRLAALGAFVQRPPGPLAAVALTIMLALAVPALSLRLGSSDAGQDPADTTTRKAYDLLAKGFGAGFNGTFQIVARTPERQGGPPEGRRSSPRR